MPRLPWSTGRPTYAQHVAQIKERIAKANAPVFNPCGCMRLGCQLCINYQSALTARDTARLSAASDVQLLLTIVDRYQERLKAIVSEFGEGDDAGAMAQGVLESRA